MQCNQQDCICRFNIHTATDISMFPSNQTPFPGSEVRGISLALGCLRLYELEGRSCFSHKCGWLVYPLTISFVGASSFNSDISFWNVEMVRDMSTMFWYVSCCHCLLDGTAGGIFYLTPWYTIWLTYLKYGHDNTQHTIHKQGGKLLQYRFDTLEYRTRQKFQRDVSKCYLLLAAALLAAPRGCTSAENVL